MGLNAIKFNLLCVLHFYSKIKAPPGHVHLAEIRFVEIHLVEKFLVKKFIWSKKNLR